MDNSLREQLISAMMRFRKSNFVLPPGTEVNVSEFFLLNSLSGDMPFPHAHPPHKVNLSDIRHHIHATKPAVSQMLNALERKGLIRREIDKNDRRKISVTLTEKGRDIQSGVKNHVDAIFEQTISRFGEDNARQLIALLTRLAEVSEDINRDFHTENHKGESM